MANRFFMLFMLTLLALYLFVSSAFALVEEEPEFCNGGVIISTSSTWNYSRYGSVPTFCVGGCPVRPNPMALCTGTGSTAECSGALVTLKGNILRWRCAEGTIEPGGGFPPTEDTSDELLNTTVSFQCSGDGCASNTVMSSFNQLVESNAKKLNSIIEEYRTRENRMITGLSNTRQALSEQLASHDNQVFANKNEIIKEVGDAKDEVIEKLDTLDFGDVDTTGLLTDSKATAMYQDMMSNVMGQLGNINGNVSSMPYTLSSISENIGGLRSGFYQDLTSLLPNYLAGQTNDIVNALSGSGSDVDLSPLEGKVDGLADDVGALDGSIKDGVDTLTGAVDGVKDAVDSGFSGLGEKLDGIINGNGNVFSAPSSGGWSAGTSIGDGVTGIESDIEALQGEFEQLVKNPPMLMGAADFNGGSYDGISFDVRGQRVSFNLFGLLGNNINLINSIIIFIATLMAAFIILSAGRNKE